MKKIIGLVVILAVLILGSYYGMGLVTERTLKRNVEIINQTSDGAKIDLKQYNRYWFTSDATADIQIHIAEHEVTNAEGKSEMVPAKDYTVNLPVKIYHGPIIFTDKTVLFGLGFAKSQLKLPQEMMDNFSKLFTTESDQPQLNVSVFVNYLNNSRFNFNVPSFKLISKTSKGQADWMGMNFDFSISSDMKKMDGNFKLNGIKLTKDNMSAVLGEVLSNYKLHKSPEGIFVGQMNLNVPSLNIQQDSTTLFQIDKLKLHSEGNVTNGLYGTKTNINLDKALVNNRNYGPGELQLSLNNLDAQVLAAILEKSRAMKTTTGPARQQALFAMLPELPKLLSKGAKFEISTLKMVVPEGNIEGHFSLEVPKGELVNAFQLIQKIEGEGQIKAPATLIKNAMIQSMKQRQQTNPAEANLPAPQKESNASSTGNQSKVVSVQNGQENADLSQISSDVDKKLTALVQAKVLKESGTDYIFEFHYSQGQLTVNGEPFNPLTFKF